MRGREDIRKQDITPMLNIHPAIARAYQEAAASGLVPVEQRVGWGELANPSNVRCTKGDAGARTSPMPTVLIHGCSGTAFRAQHVAGARSTLPRRLAFRSLAPMIIPLRQTLPPWRRSSRAGGRILRRHGENDQWWPVNYLRISNDPFGPFRFPS